MKDIQFAAIGINHDHIYDQVRCLKRAGARFSMFIAKENDLAERFSVEFPEATRVEDVRRIYESESVSVVVTAAIPAERADIAIQSMKHGKDVLSDKPGMTDLGQLDRIIQTQRETGRIYSVLYSEHFEVPATVEAGKLIAAGAIGQVVNTVGIGPHSISNGKRADWFYERRMTGGVLCDIASHQFEQFLFFSDATDGEVLSASVANRGNPKDPRLQDVGDVHLRTERTSGYIRVDWMSPKALPVWGDGRLIILGTEGYIELRKYIDITGRPGANHLFLVNKDGPSYVDCSTTELPFGRQFLADVVNRTETAMPQQRCFNAMKLALQAQQMAETGGEWK